MTEDILFETKNHLAKIILNRPQALNALNHAMFPALRMQLEQWKNDNSIKAIIIRSNCEKAFCAGGDIRAIYERRNESADALSVYFQLEYETNKAIFHYPKPIIALTQGITMGGGVGISLNTSHCVAAENLRWAMPETMIGFFPDVGATYHLSRLPHFIGTYLALTGSTINAAEASTLSLIKAIVPQQQFDALENKIAASEFNSTDFDVVTKIINLFSEKLTENTLNNEKIAACFCFSTVEEIINALKNDNTDWSNEILQQLSKRSPTSMKVALRQLALAKNKTFDEIIAMDFHIAHKMMANHDFFEGVRAAVIDKDKNPQWMPANIADVDDIENYFNG
ncbi:MAG: enoyl-CoA hydratase/isomerase family protein [Gammaproteobacteria bacterium]|nr:enoyl-CoA hydratase/isomerase family protein [Gammaproteobacteria bacterium]